MLATSDVPPDRVEAFRALHERVGLLVARFGGERRHATAGVEDPGVPVVDVRERDVVRVARSGRAVIAGTVGRVALPAAYLGARAAGVPFVFWTAFWAHPRTPAHALSLPLLLHLYRHADAVATYGDHVSAYAARHGATNLHVAPQSVDPVFWSEGAAPEPSGRFRAVFVGRFAPEKGVGVLLEAWRRSRLGDDGGELVLVGGDGTPEGRGITFAGRREPADVRNFLRSASVVVVPSVATRAFREPWGLVVNEAMHQHRPVIATDAVGAAAGGLVRHERNGLIVPAGDPDALAQALLRTARDATLRTSLGTNAARDVAAFTPQAWAAGMAGALRSAGVAMKEIR